MKTKSLRWGHCRRMFPWLALLAMPAAAAMRVHIIDVGQAASALVEFDHAAILIDAGGEDTGNNRDADALTNTLTSFFARRQDLRNILDAVIVSHPHIDHTRNLMTVMQHFTVHALIDNGDQHDASGMPQLRAAREFAAAHNIRHVTVADKDISKTGQRLQLFQVGESAGPEIRFLSGFRGCSNVNNDSIAVLIRDGKASMVFAGDSENEDKNKAEPGACATEPMLQHLTKKYSQTLLNARAYHVTHHGSANGSFPALLKKVKPGMTIISAGRLDVRTPGEFHAFQFGHPRQEAIDALIANTTGQREVPKQVLMGAHIPMRRLRPL